MTKTVLMLTAATMLRMCGRNQTPPPAAAMAAAPTQAAMAAMAPALTPEHGGYVGMLGDTVAEVASLPDGRLVMYMHDQAHAPVQAQTVQVNIMKPDGTPQSVTMTYDTTLNAYAGPAQGITAGAYPVQVSVIRTVGAAPVALTTAPIAIVPAPSVAGPGGGLNINIPIPTVGVGVGVGLNGPHIHPHIGVGIGGPHIGIHHGPF